MLIWERLKSLSFREIIKLSRFFIQSPRYLFPTYKATKVTLGTCDSKFGKKHHLDNKANAFRHALWNFMLCKYYFKISGSKENAIDKCKKITDLHEDLLPNREIARLMDLHNNKVGRNLFYQDSELDICRQLEELMKTAKRLDSVSDIKKAGDVLVYLKD